MDARLFTQGTNDILNAIHLARTHPHAHPLPAEGPAQLHRGMIALAEAVGLPREQPAIAVAVQAYRDRNMPELEKQQRIFLTLIRQTLPTGALPAPTEREIEAALHRLEQRRPPPLGG